jgi:hypothetical protein
LGEFAEADGRELGFWIMEMRDVFGHSLDFKAVYAEGRNASSLVSASLLPASASGQLRLRFP